MDAYVGKAIAYLLNIIYHQLGSTGSGNGLTPNSQQAINWTNTDPVHYFIFIYANSQMIDDAKK